MKKICVVTAARSEYGLLKWLMNDIEQSDCFELQIVVTGGHLLEEQGHTIDQILTDGFQITDIIDAKLDVSGKNTIAESMGRMGEGFASCFERLKPDYLLVLGDRYELLPICSTAFIMRIPIIHISGGDVTEGAIDDGIRNAVTMLAEYHFPATKDAKKNIVRMRGDDRNIWAVGELGLDAFYREKAMTRGELAKDLNLNPNMKWALMTYHAETRESVDYNMKCVIQCIAALLKQKDLQIVATYANADYGGAQINEYLEKQSNLHPERLRVIPSLGHARYLSFMQQVALVIGNSSSGILEAPFWSIPVINIGDRQKGRYQCKNVSQYYLDNNGKSLEELINEIINKNEADIDDKFYWGDGHTSEKILGILKEHII